MKKSMFIVNKKKVNSNFFHQNRPPRHRIRRTENFSTELDLLKHKGSRVFCTTQENYRLAENGPLELRRNSILSLEDLLLLGKDLFEEHVQQKCYSNSPNVLNYRKNIEIELKGFKTGTVKEKKIKSKVSCAKKNTVAPVRFVRPKTVESGKKIRIKNEGLTPWNASNF